MKTAPINLVIKRYFKDNNIKLSEVAKLLKMSQSNLTERLNSKRAITLDEFMELYSSYGDNFGLSVMSHYGARMLFLEKIKRMIEAMGHLKKLYSEVQGESEILFRIMGEIEKGMYNIYSE